VAATVASVFEQVIDRLERDVDELEIPVDGDALVRCFKVYGRLTAKLAKVVGECDRAEIFRSDGAVSMTAWLKAQAELSSPDAAWFVKTGQRMQQAPVTADAFLTAELSLGQMKAILANVSDRTIDRYAEGEEELLPHLRRLRVSGVNQAMQHWRRCAEDELDRDESQDNERSLHVSKTLSGRREMSGSLDAESGAVLETALRLADRPNVDGEPERSPAQRRADALVDVARFFLDNQQTNKGTRHRPHLNVFLKYDDIVRRPSTEGETLPDLAEFHESEAIDRAHGWLPDGTVLNRQSIRRLLCDSAIHRIVASGDGAILDYGRSTRSISGAVFAALVARDHHCRFPGCDRPAHWCEAHHLIPWEHGGVTSLLNLALFCVRHHHLLHSPGWNAKMRPDGTIEITNPHGQVLESRPPGSLYDGFDHLLRRPVS
jgi:uncharacterized protein DUF222